MSSFSDYLELELLDHVFGAAAYTAPATLYFALYTSAPSDTGGGTEVSGSNYSRVGVTNNATNFPAASSGSKSNGTVITFPTPSGSWGTVTHMCILDASTAGNLLGWAPLTASQVVASGNVVSYGVGTFIVTLS